MRLAELLRGALLVAGLSMGTAAAADGEYYSFDFSETTGSAVVSATRGRLTFGGDYTDYGDGRTAGGSVTGRLPFDLGVPGLEIGIGPAIRVSPDEAARLGAALAVQRYRPTDFGNVFLQASASSLDRAYFAQAQVGLAQPGVTLSLARGASTAYAETTASLSKQLGESPVSLRAGYRFVQREWFVGFSVSTF